MSRRSGSGGAALTRLRGVTSAAECGDAAAAGEGEGASDERVGDGMEVRGGTSRYGTQLRAETAVVGDEETERMAVQRSQAQQRTEQRERGRGERAAERARPDRRERKRGGLRPLRRILSLAKANSIP